VNGGDVMSRTKKKAKLRQRSIFHDIHIPHPGKIPHPVDREMRIGKYETQG
jgi:hypothetical protein